MNREQKQEVIEVLKEKFSQYSNFYITNTESLSVAQVTNLRRHCFNKQVEMKVAKNTLIRKALESLDAEKYSGVYDSLHQVTALMFSESPKEPALIISSFRKEINGEKPVLKAAFLNGDVFVGDNQLTTLTKIKTKNELIGEVIGLLMSPIQRVIGALQNKPEDVAATARTEEAPTASTESKTDTAAEAVSPVESKKEPAKGETQAVVETKAGGDVEAKQPAENKSPVPDEVNKDVSIENKAAKQAEAKTENAEDLTPKASVETKAENEVDQPQRPSKENTETKKKEDTSPDTGESESPSAS